MRPLESLFKDYSGHPYLSELELEARLMGTPNSRYSKVKRWAAQGHLSHIRRGLYCLQAGLGVKKPHPYELAQYIYGPSYISLESALSFHQLIPEAVYTTTSVTVKRTKEFNTPLGVFSYQHLPTENFLTEVTLIQENDYSFFMAKPWKAICDYIFCYKKEWNGFEPLEKSLRIAREDLPLLRDEDIVLLNEYYHHSRIERFLTGIQHER